jgi:hypothetical protein
VDAGELDYDFLAKEFSLAGGHIRSIMFNACLQSASLTRSGRGKFKGKLDMQEIIIATKREYDKLNRPISLESFGNYSGVIEKLERAHVAG